METLQSELLAPPSSIDPTTLIAARDELLSLRTAPTFELHSLIARFYQSLTAGNMTAIMEYMTPCDASLSVTFPNLKGTVRGFSDVKESLGGILQDNEGFLVVPRDVSVSVYGTTATATLVEYFTPRSSPASSRKTTVYNTSMTLKKMDKKWQIWHMHTSPSLQDNDGDAKLGRQLGSLFSGNSPNGKGMIIQSPGKLSDLDLGRLIDNIKGQSGGSGIPKIIRISNSGMMSSSFLNGGDNEDDDEDEEDLDLPQPSSIGTSSTSSSSNAVRPVFSSCLTVLRNLKDKDMIDAQLHTFLATSVVQNSLKGDKSGFVVRAFELLRGQDEEFVDVCRSFYERENERDENDENVSKP